MIELLWLDLPETGLRNVFQSLQPRYATSVAAKSTQRCSPSVGRSISAETSEFSVVCDETEVHGVLEMGSMEIQNLSDKIRGDHWWTGSKNAEIEQHGALCTSPG